jgi:hypothetical protein
MSDGNERMDRIESAMDRFERGLEHLLQVSAKHDALQASNEEAIGKLTQAQADLTVTMNRLANIVIRHEERLDALDGGDE